MVVVVVVVVVAVVADPGAALACFSTLTEPIVRKSLTYLFFFSMYHRYLLYVFCTPGLKCSSLETKTAVNCHT